MLAGSLTAAAVLVVGAVVVLARWPNPVPETVALPLGFQPEGIAVGPGSTLYVGSIPSGAVYRADARTGRGALLVPGREGRSAIGLDHAGDRLYVAGGATGRAYVYEAETGREVAAPLLAPSGQAFINDVVVTGGSAYFTDSLNPAIYRVDVATLDVAAVPLSGDIRYEPGFNANGVEATPDGRALVVVQTNTGELFTVDPQSGSTVRIRLDGGKLLANGDGLLLDGRRLLVVQNLDNQVTEVRLDVDRRTGAVTGRVRDPRFDAPTTVARLGDRLYVVNARVGLADPARARYRVVSVALPTSMAAGSAGQRGG